MTGKPPIHTVSSGKASGSGAPGSFGRRGVASPHEAAGRAVFGKRVHPAERQVSFRRERLRIVGAELDLLFAYRIEADAPFTCLVERDEEGRELLAGQSLAGRAGEPALAIGRAVGLAATLLIEPQSGFLVLYGGGPGDCVLMTSSEERMLDHVAALVLSAPGYGMPRTADGATDMLVGRSITEVEQRLILRTLLHHGGDRHQAAFALGLDEAELRARLRRIFREKVRAVPLPREAPQ